MRTIKNSISMKAILSAVFAVSFAAFVNGQFQTPSPDAPVTQTPTEEARTGSSIVYNVSAEHTSGDRYRWEVTGGTITAAVGGTISGAGNNIVEFAADVTTITVNWDQAPTAIASLSAQIQVQKISATGSCYSQIQTLPINVWNLPTANITDTDTEFCSGGSTAGSITVNLEGAPAASGDGFSVSYEYVVSNGDGNLTDGVAAEVNGQTGTVETNSSSVSIPLPASLVNLTGSSQTFAVNLTLMQDDFDDQNGTWTAEGGSYVITVYPVPVTGDIQSSFSLTRR